MLGTREDEGEGLGAAANKGGVPGRRRRAAASQLVSVAGATGRMNPKPPDKSIINDTTTINRERNEPLITLMRGEVASRGKKGHLWYV